MKKKLMAFISVLFLMSTTSVKAEVFWVTGTIQRTLSNDTAYGGCMILLSKAIGNGCPSAPWVSLGCSGRYFKKNSASRNYATAIVAASMKKQVSVQVDNSERYNGYCVVQRLDVLF